MGDVNGFRRFEGIRHPKHGRVDLTGPMRIGRAARVRAGLGRAALAKAYRGVWAPEHFHALDQRPVGQARVNTRHELRPRHTKRCCVESRGGYVGETNVPLAIFAT
jgi:hypothetical protein